MVKFELISIVGGTNTDKLVPVTRGLTITLCVFASFLLKNHFMRKYLILCIIMIVRMIVVKHVIIDLFYFSRCSLAVIGILAICGTIVEYCSKKNIKILKCKYCFYYTNHIIKILKHNI